MKKLFGTDGIRGKAGEYPITAAMAELIGKAIVIWLKKENVSIIIGRDTRKSGEELEDSAAKGITSTGGNALIAGVIPTPAVAFLVKKHKADAGIVISASHNPAEDNGLKIFGSDGYKLEDAAEEEIEQIIFSKAKTAKIKNGKKQRLKTAKEDYAEFLKNNCSCSLNGIKIILDCANGASHNIAPELFRQLGAKVIEKHCEPDGSNINKDCGALSTKSTEIAIRKEKADIGFCFDGDADRIIAVDEKGNVVDGDKIIYLCAKELAKKGKLKDNIVITTVMSNTGLGIALNKQGIAMIRTKVGDRYVIKKLKQGRCSLGGEQSGHIIFSEKSTTGDGILCALQLAGILKNNNFSFSELCNDIEIYPQILINIPVKEKRDFNEMPEVKAAIETAEKLLGNTGRVLVRYSGTENLARVMVEGKDKGLTANMAEEIAKKIKESNGI